MWSSAVTNEGPILRGRTPIVADRHRSPGTVRTRGPRDRRRIGQCRPRLARPAASGTGRDRDRRCVHPSVRRQGCEPGRGRGPVGRRRALRGRSRYRRARRRRTGRPRSARRGLHAHDVGRRRNRRGADPGRPPRRERCGGRAGRQPRPHTGRDRGCDPRRRRRALFVRDSHRNRRGRRWRCKRGGRSRDRQSRAPRAPGLRTRSSHPTNTNANTSAGSRNCCAVRPQSSSRTDRTAPCSTAPTVRR